MMNKLLHNKRDIISLMVFIATLGFFTIIRFGSSIRSDGVYFNVIEWLYSDILLSIITNMFGNLLAYLMAKKLPKPRSCKHIHCNTNQRSTKRGVCTHRGVDGAVIIIFVCIILECIAAYVENIAYDGYKSVCISIATAVMLIVNALMFSVMFNYATRSSRCCGF